MLICLVLCAAAVLPTAISDRAEAQNVQPHPGRNNEVARRLAAGYAAAQNQGLLHFRNYEEEESTEEADPYLFDTVITFRTRKPYPLDFAESELGENIVARSLDQIGGGHLIRRGAILSPVIDQIGGGHLLRRQLLDKNNRIRGHLSRRGAIQSPVLDQIGGGHLLRRQLLEKNNEIGGGQLSRRGAIQSPVLDQIGGGHLLRRQLLENNQSGGGRPARGATGGELKRSTGFRSLDPIGGGHLLKRDGLDEIGGGHLLKRAFPEKEEEEIPGETLSNSETDSEAYVL